METQTGTDAVCVALNADVYSGVRAITARQCQLLESQFVVKKSTTLSSVGWRLVPACIMLNADFNSACLCTAVLLIASHGHRHRYGTSDFPTDENRYSSFFLAFDNYCYIHLHKNSDFWHTGN